MAIPAEPTSGRPPGSTTQSSQDDGTSQNTVVNSTRDPIDDAAPGASFMLVGMSYPIVAAIVALAIGLGIWIARHYGG